MDFWCSQVGVVFKHVSASTNDMDLQYESMEQVENKYHVKTKIEAITSQSTQQGKQKFHDQALAMFAKVVENSFIMMKNFQQTIFYYRKLTFILIT
jgi:hypothetical protein